MEIKNALVGLLYCIVSLVFFVLNGLLLMALLKHSEYKSSSYRIIRNMCVASMFQLFPLFIGGLMTLANTSFHYYVDRVLGVLIQSGWFLYIALSLTLAIDRLVIFAFLKNPNCKNKIANSLLISSWLFWLFIVVVLCQPGCGYSYADEDHYLIAWRSVEGDWSALMFKTEAFIDPIIFAIILLIYLIVSGYLVKTKLSFTVRPPSFAVEIRIFLVAVISFFYESFFVVYSFWLLPATVDHRAMDICINLAWIVDCGLFAMVTLIVSQSLRLRVFELMMPRETSTPVSVLNVRWNSTQK